MALIESGLLLALFSCVTFGRPSDMGKIVSDTKPTVISAEFEEIHASKGDDISLSCPKFSSNADRRLIWSRNTKILYDGELEVVSNWRYRLLDSGTLYIANLNKKDAGNFTCSYAATDSEGNTIEIPLSVYIVYTGDESEKAESTTEEAMVIRTIPHASSLRTLPQNLQPTNGTPQSENFSTTTATIPLNESTIIVTFGLQTDQSVTNGIPTLETENPLSPDERRTEGWLAVATKYLMLVFVALCLLIVPFFVMVLLKLIYH